MVPGGYVIDVFGDGSSLLFMLESPLNYNL